MLFADAYRIGDSFWGTHETSAAPQGLWIVPLAPMAYAMGYIFSPLRGWTAGRATPAFLHLSPRG